MTKDQIESLRNFLKEIGSIRSMSTLNEIDQLCDMAEGMRPHGRTGEKPLRCLPADCLRGVAARLVEARRGLEEHPASHVRHGQRETAVTSIATRRKSHERSKTGAAMPQRASVFVAERGLLVAVLQLPSPRPGDAGLRYEDVKGHDAAHGETLSTKEKS